MQFGVTMLGRDLGTVRACVRLAEDLGFSGFGLGDVPALALDPFVALAAVAEATASLRLGITVLNPRTRHPLVVANACLALDRLAPNRVFLGIGAGNSGVRQVGMQPAGLGELRQAVIGLRGLIAGQPAEFQGRPLSLGGRSARVPVFVSASGPKVLRLAGEVADGALINVGADPATVERALAEVRSGAESAGRDWRSIETWVFGIGFLDEDRTAAVEQVKSAVTGASVYLLQSSIAARGLPPETAAATSDLIARYDYAEHFAPGRSANARLVDELGLADLLVSRFSFAGTPDDVRRRIAALQSIGVDRFWLSLSGAEQPEVQLRRFAEALGPRTIASTSFRRPAWEAP